VAAYWISERATTPIACTEIDDALRALTARAVELRVVSSLWPLRDAVVASSLGFSIIRMRNAAQRTSEVQSDVDPRALRPGG
jgi:uncharacterized protein DUF6886